MAAISGTVKIAGDPVDWIACAFDADAHAFAGVATVSAGAYAINGLTAGKAYVVSCRPASGGAWRPLAPFGMGGFVLPANPSATPYIFKATKAGDAIFSDVILLLECEGAANSTTFSDTSTLNNPVSAYGGAKISAAQFKHGLTSCGLGATGYLELPNTSDFLFSGDFTVEFWAFGDITGSAIFSNAAMTYLYNDALTISGTSVISSLGCSTAPGWRHYAICRAGNSVRFFENGIQKGTTGTKTGNADFRALNIGRYQPNGNLFFSSYVDDIRITRQARYTSGFTTPGELSGSLSGASEPVWPNSVGGSIIDGGVTWTNMGHVVQPLMQGPLIAV